MKARLKCPRSGYWTPAHPRIYNQNPPFAYWACSLQCVEGNFRHGYWAARCIQGFGDGDR
eukprot:8087767-Lingulodinium_polyedra.AAC.1